MNQRIKISANTTVATIDIEGEIGSEQSGAVTTYGALKEKLQQIEELEAPVVVVNIRSVGGDVADALLIYEALVAACHLAYATLQHRAVSHNRCESLVI